MRSQYFQQLENQNRQSVLALGRKENFLKISHNLRGLFNPSVPVLSTECISDSNYQSLKY